MTVIPGDRRVWKPSDLATIDATVGTIVWVDSEERSYEAIPSSVGIGITGPVDITPISWIPTGTSVAIGQERFTQVEYVFNDPDTLPVTGTRGEQVNYSHTGTRYVMRNGVRTAVTTDVPAVDDWGLVIEPACTNLEDQQDFSAAGWEKSNITVTGGQADPFGTTLASLMDEGTANAAHWVYDYFTFGAQVYTISVYFKLVSTAQTTFIRFADNASNHVAFWNCATGECTSFSGSDTLAKDAEYLGNGWFRASMSCTPTTGLWSIAISDIGDNSLGTVHVGTNRQILVSHPQIEARSYCTSWTAYGSPRPANACFLQLQPKWFNADWSIDLEVQTVEGGSWEEMASDRIIASLGYYAGQGNTWVLRTHGVNLSLDVIGADGDTATLTKAGALAAGSNYTGPRRITVASSGVNRPALFVDGKEILTTRTGSSSGAITVVAHRSSQLYLGCTSAAGTQGGFRFRSVRMSTARAPSAGICGAYSYAWPHSDGFTTRAHRAAFIGDSITEGIYDTGLTPYPRITRDLLGSGWVEHNYGVGGDTTGQVLARIEADVLTHTEYKKVVLFCGINDVNVGVSNANVVAGILRCADALVAQFPGKVWVVNLLPASGGSANIQAINASIAANAAGHGYTVINAYTSFDDPGNPGTMLASLGDGLHPNQTGLNLLGQIVATAIA